MASLKPDADRIQQVLRQLQSQDWLARTERKWWPRFLFHYTDLQNAVSILKDGCLVSRQQLERQGRSFVNGGSPRVLDGTAVPILDCVRLYFRPQTPAQFHTEGIRSKDTITSLKAHCPLPVFLLFDSAHVLSLANCRFSDGNLASGRALQFSTAAQLQNLPWKEIYHVGAFDPYDPAQDITFHRSAEVIVPERLTLDALAYVYCRSAAEKDTLLSLLGTELRQRYQPRIASSARSMLFFRRHTFVETANLSKDGAQFQFSPDTESPGPFDVRVEALDFQTLDTHVLQVSQMARGPFAVRFRVPMSEYRVRLTLDGHLAYDNGFRATEMPF